MQITPTPTTTTGTVAGAGGVQQANIVIVRPKINHFLKKKNFFL